MKLSEKNATINEVRQQMIDDLNDSLNSMRCAGETFKRRDSWKYTLTRWASGFITWVAYGTGYVWNSLFGTDL